MEIDWCPHVTSKSAVRYGNYTVGGDGCVAWRESDRSQSEDVSLYSHSHTHSYAHRELSLLGEESNKEVPLFTICSWHSYKLFGHLWTYTAFLSCRTEVSLTSLRTFCKLTGTLTLLSKTLPPALSCIQQPTLHLYSLTYHSPPIPQDGSVCWGVSQISDGCMGGLWLRIPVWEWQARYITLS